MTVGHRPHDVAALVLADLELPAVRRSAEEFVAPYRSGDGGYDLPACALVPARRLTAGSVPMP